MKFQSKKDEAIKGTSLFSAPCIYMLRQRPTQWQGEARPPCMLAVLWAGLSISITLGLLRLSSGIGQDSPVNGKDSKDWEAHPGWWQSKAISWALKETGKALATQIWRIQNCLMRSCLVCIQAQICMGTRVVRVHVHMCRLRVDVRCLPWWLSMLYTEAGPLDETRVPQSQLNYIASLPRQLPVSASHVLGLQETTMSAQLLLSSRGPTSHTREQVLDSPGHLLALRPPF